MSSNGLVCIIVRLLPLGAVDDPMHYCTRPKPLGAVDDLMHYCTEPGAIVHQATTVPRGNSLTVLQTGMK